MSLIPLETDLFGGINNAGSQAADAMGTVGYAALMAILVTVIWKTRGALAGMLAGAFAAAVGYWLLKLDGLATIAQSIDYTWQQLTK